MSYDDICLKGLTSRGNLGSDEATCRTSWNRSSLTDSSMEYLFRASRLTLGPTQWISGALSPGAKIPGREYSPLFVFILKMGDAIPPLSHIPMCLYGVHSNNFMASDIDWEAASRIQTRSLSASLTDDCYCPKILSELLVLGQLTLKFLQAAFAMWMRIHCVEKLYTQTIYVVFPVLVKLRRLV